MTIYHASCVAIGCEAVLLIGESGSGKSDLALRLIDEGGVLVADDQVDIRLEGAQLIARAPEKLCGLIEVYGLGILKNVKHVQDVPIALVVQMTPFEALERLPEKDAFSAHGVDVKKIRLKSEAVSATAKIRAALQGEFLPMDQML